MKTQHSIIHTALAAAFVGALVLSSPKAQAGNDRGAIIAGALIGGALAYIISENDSHDRIHGGGYTSVIVQQPAYRCPPAIVQRPVYHPRPMVVQRPTYQHRPVFVQPKKHDGGHTPKVNVTPKNQHGGHRRVDVAAVTQRGTHRGGSYRRR